MMTRNHFPTVPAARGRARQRARAGRLALAALAAAGAVGLAAAPAAQAKAKAETTSCKRLTGAAQRACRARNAANKTVLNQLKNSRLVGTRGDGASIDWLFCASGKYELRTTSGGSTGVSSGTTWIVKDARVRNGSRWIEATISSPKGTAVGVLRRGGRWQVAVESLGRMLYPGAVEKTRAGDACT